MSPVASRPPAQPSPAQPGSCSGYVSQLRAQFGSGLHSGFVFLLRAQFGSGSCSGFPSPGLRVLRHTGRALCAARAPGQGTGKEHLQRERDHKPALQICRKFFILLPLLPQTGSEGRQPLKKTHFMWGKARPSLL